MRDASGAILGRITLDATNPPGGATAMRASTVPALLVIAVLVAFLLQPDWFAPIFAPLTAEWTGGDLRTKETPCSP